MDPLCCSCFTHYCCHSLLWKLWRSSLPARWQFPQANPALPLSGTSPVRSAIAERVPAMNFPARSFSSRSGKPASRQFGFLVANSELPMQQLEVKCCFCFEWEHINFSCQKAFIFKAVLGMKTERRCRLKLLSVSFCLKLFFPHFLVLLGKPNPLLIASPVLVCDRELKQAPASLVALWWHRRSLAVKSHLCCCSRLFLVFSPLLSPPICVFLSIFLPVFTPGGSSSLLSEGTCAFPLLGLTWGCAAGLGELPTVPFLNPEGAFRSLGDQPRSQNLLGSGSGFFCVVFFVGFLCLQSHGMESWLCKAVAGFRLSQEGHPRIRLAPKYSGVKTSDDFVPVVRKLVLCQASAGSPSSELTSLIRVLDSL